MRPVRSHACASNAGLRGNWLCSNSLKSDSEKHRALAAERRNAPRGIVRWNRPRNRRCPGHALAVDRAEFSRKVTEAISREALIHICRQEDTDEWHFFDQRI